MMKWLLSIDPSLTGTAACVMHDSGDYQCHRFGSEPAKGVVERFARYGGLVESVMRALPHSVPSAIVIEGYSFASKGAMQIDRYEYGGVLRHRLLSVFPGVPFHECPPMTLKLFVMSIGRGDKADMRLATFKRWGESFSDDDSCDAFGLAKLGAAMLGWQPCDNESQRRAVDSVMYGKAKKSKRKSA